VGRPITGPCQQGGVFRALFASGSDQLQWNSHPASRYHWRVNFYKISHPHPHLLVAVNRVHPFTTTHHQQVWGGYKL